ncbi:kinase inhibitor [Serratia oryzae]|uniref:Kinase inhibitor n=1 Tax=Serratia oryzae TaxID=2034155 RepID=A0A1S8CPY2_9GAMM|nr:kinase inhibitor [Serratia oryzae]OMQ26950.1 kinase inhibitor [Serratia oryzae]
MKQMILGLGLMAIALGAEAEGFSVSSSDMEAGKPLASAQVFQGFGCQGGNVSPQLAWAHVPPGTKSFAVTAFDPDAPTGSGWWHWTVVNIPAYVRALPAGAGNVDNQNLPPGAVQGRNDFGYAGFGGACPPEGTPAHRYQFTVWALKTAHLPIDNTSSGAMVGFMLKANALATTRLEAIYGR